MALSNQNITIHIGMPKSASTTIQRYFMSGLKDVHYFGAEDFSEGTKLFLEILNKEDLKFDASANEAALETHIDPSKPVIFSSEFACGLRSPLLSGQVQSRKTIFDRLTNVAPQAKILIILRNQFDLQKSFHAQLLKKESTFLDIDNFTLDAWMDKNINLHNQHWPSVFDFAEYYDLVKMYKNTFQNVHVVLFEEIVKDMESFVNEELTSFMQLDKKNIDTPFINKVENIRYDTSNIKANNFINRVSTILKKRFGNPLGKVDKDKKEKVIDTMIQFSGKIFPGKKYTSYSEKHQLFIRDFYADSNKKLASLLDKDLEKLGYPV